MKLNLGCGENKLVGYTNVDDFAKYNPDVLANLDSMFPFVDNSVSQIVAYNILEHVSNPVHFLHECYRVMKPNATIVIGVPSYKESTAFVPDHKTVFSRKWFILGLADDEEYQQLPPFKIQHIKFIFGKGHRFIDRLERTQTKPLSNSFKAKVFDALDLVYQVAPNWSERFLWQIGYEVTLRKE